MKLGKQPNQVRENKIQCINYQICPICYGCRAYDSRYEDCVECYQDGIDESNRNFNVCNTELHEAWKINRMITKHVIDFSKEENVKFKSK